MLAIKKYRDLIKKEEFFAAHEVFEAFWFPRRKRKERELLIVKGFINAAVAFELKKRGRDKSARSVWQTYKKFCLLLNENDVDLLELKEFIDNYAKKYLFK